MTPSYLIIAEGADVTAKFADRLISIEVTDVDGVESDTLEIEVDDRDNAVALPQKGALLQVWMGYIETGLDLMGTYKVDEVTVEAGPDKIIVHAKAAELKDSFKQQKSRHWENTTVGDIVSKIAGEHELSAAVDPQLAQRKVAYVAQTEESDLHFLTRLARRHDAMIAPKNGRLVGVRRGDGRSGSGEALSAIVLRKSDVTTARSTVGDRPKHGAIEADWYDRDGAERKTVTVPQGGGEGPRMRLPHPYPSEEEAERAAEARGRELERAEGSLSVEMPGNPAISAEMHVTMGEGFRDGIAGTWTIQQVSHRIETSFTTSFECGKGDDQGGGSGSGNGGSSSSGGGEDFYGE